MRKIAKLQIYLNPTQRSSVKSSNIVRYVLEMRAYPKGFCLWIHAKKQDLPYAVKQLTTEEGLWSLQCSKCCEGSLSNTTCAPCTSCVAETPPSPTPACRCGRPWNAEGKKGPQYAL